ncbi:MAG: hypothetical protein JEY99_06375 [Spirochaetales bacterium]|nr:hypothetical protein [Spirochaetales bacterium]
MKKNIINQSITTLLVLIIPLLSLSSCGQLPDYRNLDNIDLKPPRIKKIIPSGELTIEILFDEPLLEQPEIILSPDPGMEKLELLESSLTLYLLSPQETGRKYTIQGIARDRSGNSLTFQYHFYGYNPMPPDIIINEFTCQGSGKHPDLVELKVTERGNIGGMVLCEGTTDYLEEKFVFPPLDVEAGDYILIHFKPQGIPEERNESDMKDESGGYDAHPLCLDFWVPGGTGLGGNNGTLALYAFPEGPLLDGLLYSTRTSSSDTDYRGFGSKKVMNRADQLFNEGGWNISEEEVRPEDGINPEDSTSTRSICRMNNSENTRSKNDWHITPTGGSSFGEENTDEVYSRD